MTCVKFRSNDTCEEHFSIPGLSQTNKFPADCFDNGQKYVRCPVTGLVLSKYVVGGVLPILLLIRHSPSLIQKQEDHSHCQHQGVTHLADTTPL